MRDRLNDAVSTALNQDFRRDTHDHAVVLLLLDIRRLLGGVALECELPREEVTRDATKPPENVGCERLDGTLNIHPRSERCEVCARPVDKDRQAAIVRGWVR